MVVIDTDPSVLSLIGCAGIEPPLLSLRSLFALFLGTALDPAPSVSPRAFPSCPEKAPCDTPWVRARHFRKK